MLIPEFGVKRPVTNLMIFSSILIIALYSLSRIGIDMMPEIEPPMITVISSYPGASPEDVEVKVTEPLENQLSTTPGLEKITSNSVEGASVVTLKFIWGTNLDEASNDIRDRIERTKRFLPDIPDEMDNPFIFKFNTANMPIGVFGVTAKQSYADLYDIIDKRVGDELRQLSGVGTVQLHGGLQRQINIWIDKTKLEGYGFSILDITSAIGKENISLPLGSIKSGLSDYLLRLPGEFASPQEIDSVILGKRNGDLIYLKDVARIEDGFKELTSHVRIDKRPGLIMMVQKQTGTNTVEVAARIKKKIKQLEKNLPTDIKIFHIFDTAQEIIDSINSLRNMVWIAITLVIFVVWFFLRRFLPSAIIALTIPFSLMISFVYLFLSGKTINVISLSSLAIASGMVVDSAVVVVDNVVRKLERGNRPQEAAVFGASEIFLALGASTLTTVVVFLPMLFITGVVGIMFGELAIVVTVTLLASLFTAVTFAPMLCSKWLKSGQNVSNGNSKGWLRKFYNISESRFRRLEEKYSKALGWSLNHKKTIILGFTAVLLVSLSLVPSVGSEFAPEEDSGDMRITVSLPIGTRLEETDKVARRIEEIIKKEVPEARFMYARVGQEAGIGRVMGGASGPHIIACGAKLVPKTERKRSSKEVANVLRAEIKKIAGVIKTDVSSGNPMSRMITGGGGKAIQVEIVGHSFEQTDNLAVQIKQIMEKVPGCVDVAVSRDVKAPEIRIAINREKAASLGFNMKAVADSVKNFIQGSTAAKYREMGQTYDIFVQMEESGRTKIEDVENLAIVSPYSGKHIKLSSFAKVYEALGPLSVERKNRERVVRVEANTYKRSIGKVVEDIKAGMQGVVIPEGITVNFGGEAEEQQKAFKDLFLLLMLGIVLVYMVMAAQFESLVDPFIIMFAIPFTFTGVIWAFVLTNTTLSTVTFLGIVMLMGIVVNNAIVLVSYIGILRRRGYSMIEAVTLGGKDRLRPVLMTTITTLSGWLPLALSTGQGSETWQPLGITMMGGLAVSTLVTLLFVPTMYAVFHRKKVKSL